MNAMRGVVVGLLAVAVVVVAVVLLSGGDSHEYKLQFTNAGQLVKGDDVQIGGRRIGAVKKIDLTDDNVAQITITVKSPFAPLHQGTLATIRTTSLSGIANRYISLTPGADNMPELDDGAKLGLEKTQTPVDLDQLFDTIDPPTRQGLQKLIQGFATQYEGKGKQANVNAHYFNPALSTTSRLVNALVADQPAFEKFIQNSSKVVTTLASRGPQLTSLVGNANQTTGAIASENQALSQSLQLLPGTLRKANNTFGNLNSTLDDLDRLTDASKPATKNLAKFLRQLRPLVANARPTVRDLRHLVTEPGRGNDAIDLLNKAPGLEKVAGPTFEHTIAALKKSDPVLAFARPYVPDLEGWLRDFGQGAANYDANGHYARIQPIFNVFSIANNTATLNTKNRLQGLNFGASRRCPGAASQYPDDNSAPFRDSDGKLDCDPSQVPPGP